MATHFLDNMYAAQCVRDTVAHRQFSEKTKEFSQRTTNENKQKHHQKQTNKSNKQENEQAQIAFVACFRQKLDTVL